MKLYVDADACPVKEEIIRVAERHRMHMFFVCDGGLRRPNSAWAKLIIVDQGADAADDWIADRIQPGDICVTGDIPLADRCLKAGGHAIDHKGKPFTVDNIGSAVAMRNLMSDLRDSGMMMRGGKPFSQQDRSAFLNGLEVLIQKAKRAR